MQTAFFPGAKSLLMALALLPLVLVFSLAKAASAPTVAVMPFRDLSGSKGHIGEALRETVTADIKELSVLRVIERDALDKVLSEQALQAKRDDLDPSTASRVGKLLGATYMVTGAYQKAVPSVRLTARVVRVETGEIIGTAKVDGKEAEILRLQDQVTSALLRSAGFLAQAKKVEGRKRATIKTIKTVEIYGEALRAKDDQERLGLLKLAVAADSSFVYAVNDLRALEQRLARYQIAADEATDKKVKDLQEKLAAAKDLQAADQPARDLFLMLVQARRYYGLQREARAYLKRDYPVGPAVGLGGQVAGSVELARFYLVMADVNVKHRDAILSDGEEFLKRHPTSLYFQSVKSMIATAIQEKRQADVGLEKAASEVAALPEGQKWDLCRVGLVYRANQANVPAQRLYQACLLMGTSPKKDVLRDLVQIEYQNGDFPAMRRDLAALSQEDPAMYSSLRGMLDAIPSD